MKSKKTQYMSIMAMFLAIQIILVVTPLGYLPIGPISATTMHIPVIIAGIALGKKAGAQLGFVFGLTSVLNATFRPTLTSFCFSPFVTIGGNCLSPLCQGFCWDILPVLFMKSCAGRGLTKMLESSPEH